jgi:hypothetical protein
MQFLSFSVFTSFARFIASNVFSDNIFYQNDFNKFAITINSAFSYSAHIEHFKKQVGDISNFCKFQMSMRKPEHPQTFCQK